jgi:putative two-component system response regulator
MDNNEAPGIVNEDILEIIQRLVFATEYKNADGFSHLQRVSHYAELLAKAHGLPKRVCEFIRLASPMHDIGKVGISDSILLKPGKLTPEEWETMKTHTTIGSQLLSECTSPILQIAQVIAVSHHERWDGTGYPQGLRETDIPIAGRIMAIVDVFDAITSDRPYEKAWPVSEAVNVIKLGSETQFDPQLVLLFEHILPEFLKVRKSFPDSNTPPDTRAVKFWRNSPVIARLCEAISPELRDCFVEDSSQ